MEVYIDDMLTKSADVKKHVEHLKNALMRWGKME